MPPSEAAASAAPAPEHQPRTDQTPDRTSPAAGRAVRRLDRVRLGVLCVAGLVLGCAAGAILLLSDVMPQIEQLSSYRPALSTRVYARDGSLFTEYATEKRVLLPLSAVPPQLRQAFLAVEDDGFYDHIGVRPRHILRAMVANAKAGRRRYGGSTITQQLARNLFLSFERTYSRKLREALLSLQIERLYSKDEILELYLNQIYLGAGFNGVGMAARGYFDKEAVDLTLGECALLAALPKAPNRYSPRNNLELARKRRDIVLKRLHDLRWIDTPAYQAAKNEPIVLRQATDTKAEGGYFGEHVRRVIHRDYGYDKLYKTGLVVESTIDPEMQQAAQAAVAAGLARLEQRRAEEFDTRRLRELRREARRRAIAYEELSRAALEEELAGLVPPPTPDFKPIQAALIAIDPHTGAVRAMIGGRDFMESEFNRAVQARRQIGSAFKPIVWTAAFERGWTPSDTIVDAPVIFHYTHDGETLEWLPENYEERFYGPTTLREGLEHSRNIVAIKLLNEVGIGTTVRLARRMGIESYLDRNLTLALGSSSATPLEVAGAYTSFANGGVAVRPFTITRIKRADGAVIYEHLPEEHIAMSEQSAYLTTSLLEQVIRRGTAARALKDFPWTIAGKTGTTDDCTDAWFVGYTPTIVCAVWVGYDQIQPLGKRWTGGRVAAPIWRDFMEVALTQEPSGEFPVPPNIVFKDIEMHSGMLAPEGYSKRRVVRQPYVRGTEPQDEFVPGRTEVETTYMPLHLYESDTTGVRL